jgi:C1A family cysteine protease
MSHFIPPGLGWQPSLDDPRDYTLDHPQVQELIGDLNLGQRPREKSADLREFFPEVEDQGPLNSSCAFAVLGLVEYFETRCHDSPLEASRLFLYQMALRLRGTTDDVGTDLRTTLKALRRFGSPPQPFWPYRPDRFHDKPTDPFLFAFARDYQHLRYFRLDAPNDASPPGRCRVKAIHDETLTNLKSLLAAGFPFVLGFRVPATLSADGLVWNSTRSFRFRGGQAAMAVGFDDALRIGSHKGALLIRSSWGSRWGDQGYGWLPYVSVASPYVADLWSPFSPGWRGAGRDW